MMKVGEIGEMMIEVMKREKRGNKGREMVD